LNPLQYLCFVSKHPILEVVVQNPYTVHKVLSSQKIERAEGVVRGGNMVNVERTFETCISIRLQHTILVLEDVDEPARKMDGFLHQLSRNPEFSKLSAIIFGDFVGNIGTQADQIIREFANNVKVPIFRFDPENTIGHGEVNVPLVFNTPSTIDCTFDIGKCTLSMSTSGTIAELDNSNSGCKHICTEISHKAVCLVIQ